MGMSLASFKSPIWGLGMSPACHWVLLLLITSVAEVGKIFSSAKLVTQDSNSRFSCTCALIGEIPKQAAYKLPGMKIARSTSWWI